MIEGGGAGEGRCEELWTDGLGTRGVWRAWVLRRRLISVPKRNGVGSVDQQVFGCSSSMRSIRLL